jgi:transposase
MPNFRPYNYDQTTMVVINYLEQLQPGTFEHALHYLVDNKLDLSVYYPKYQNEDTGRPAYDPALLIKIILFAYSKGITSSREIQWCCETNIIFKALSCNTVPHYTTIAAFVSGRTSEIESLFEQILLICDEQGLLGKELFAIDGCKMPSNAAKEWSGTLKELGEKRDKIKRQIRHHISEHQRIDKSESRDAERERRLSQTIDTLNKAHDKIDQFLKTATPRMGKGKKPQEVKSNITDNESCKVTTSKGTIQGYNGVATVDKKHQIIIDAQAFGEGQEHHTLQPVLEKVKDRFQRLGISQDIYKEGAVITADTGYANENNNQYLHENKIDGYIPDNKFRSRDPKFTDQKKKYGQRRKGTQTVILAREFKLNEKEKTCVCPAGKTMRLKKEGEDASGHYKLFFVSRLRDCRECELKNQCMRTPDTANTRAAEGRQVSFITSKTERKPTANDWMKQRVDSDRGKQIYSHRMSVVEPVFGNIGSNKKLNRFSLRGKQKVQGQWQLYSLVHNIQKLANYGQMTA